MLFMNSDNPIPQRVQGAMVTDNEIDKLVTFWRKIIPPSDNAEAPACPWENLIINTDETAGDALVEKAVEMVRGMNKVSASLLQRRMRIGYPRAARLMDELEKMGVVGPLNPGGRERDVLVGPDDGEVDSSDEMD
jgi:S-DNA-T family DNA segregation ATPase FtsK/SpoIIIE